MRGDCGCHKLCTAKQQHLHKTLLTVCRTALLLFAAIPTHLHHTCISTSTGRQQQRQDLYDAIAAAQTRLDAAQRRRDLAVRDLTRAKSELERLRSSAKASKATKQRLTDAATAEANWLAARPHAAALLGMAAGPLTQQVSCEQ